MNPFESMLVQVKNDSQSLRVNQVKGLRIDQLVRLLTRLSQDSELRSKILDGDQSTFDLIDECITLINRFVTEEYITPKGNRFYQQKLNALTKRLRLQYQMRPKGSFLSLYMILGIAVGTAIGAIFLSTSSNYYAISISIGMVIGIVIGNQVEAGAKKKNLIY